MRKSTWTGECWGLVVRVGSHTSHPNLVPRLEVTEAQKQLPRIANFQAEGGQRSKKLLGQAPRVGLGT